MPDQSLKKLESAAEQPQSSKPAELSIAGWPTDSNLRLDASLKYEPERVVSIVSSSRSGSTIIKYALCLHEELTTLAGEEEPYYKMTQNGYPWHESDEFHEACQPEIIRWLITNEVHNHHSEHNRKILRENHIEEPPYVEPIECRRTPTLVLKTPQNCYRRGVIEQLYPESEIIYLAVTRDPRAIVNGMIDAWESESFTARETPEGWWCLDMPPGWSWKRELVDRCVHQWKSSWLFINRYYPDLKAMIRYEEFDRDWVAICEPIWKMLGLGPYKGSKYVPLPWLACTDLPKMDRWKEKRPWLAETISDA